MQLHELIEQEGIQEINLKTSISEETLMYLSDEDFEKLTRVKSLGFLVILEREYKDFDPSILRERIKLYFENHEPDVDNVIVISKQNTSSGEGFSFFKWFIIFAIFLGAWYLYSQGSLDELVKNIESKENTFDDQKALENNISVKEAEKVLITTDNKKPIEIEVPVAPKMEKSIVLTDKNYTSDEQRSVVQELTDNSSVANMSKVEEDYSLIETKEVNIVDNNETDVVITTITVNPTRGMLWFGFINIDTKERDEFMKKVSTPFDLEGGRYLLVTGHGFVDIVSELKTVEVADRVKHYFYIDSKEIREITQKEFRDMNGRRGW